MIEDELDCNIDDLLEEYERHENNLIDLEDLRFGEIYLND